MSADWLNGLVAGLALALPFYLTLDVFVTPRLAHWLRVLRVVRRG